MKQIKILMSWDVLSARRVSFFTDISCKVYHLIYYSPIITGTLNISKLRYVLKSNAQQYDPGNAIKRVAIVTVFLFSCQSPGTAVLQLN